MIVPAVSQEARYRQAEGLVEDLVAVGTGDSMTVGVLAVLLLLVSRMAVLAEDCEASVWV